jgi:DNA-binding transcriptional MocR family regulator
MSGELEVAGRNGSRESRALLKQSLAARLRDEILQGRIAPGPKIIEGRWARHFGVAQLSIREALNILAAEGFVTKRHGRGARVLTLTETDILHIDQIRGAKPNSSGDWKAADRALVCVYPNARSGQEPRRIPVGTGGVESSETT